MSFFFWVGKESQQQMGQTTSNFYLSIQTLYSHCINFCSLFTYYLLNDVSFSAIDVGSGVDVLDKKLGVHDVFSF